MNKSNINKSKIILSGLLISDKKEVIRLEDLMYGHAKNLEFEEAAAHRDRVSELKEKLFMS